MDADADADADGDADGARGERRSRNDGGSGRHDAPQSAGRRDEALPADEATPAAGEAADGSGESERRRLAEEHEGARAEPQPPPREGMLWEIGGEIRMLLMLPAAMTMQVAHPAVGAGVDDHSVFRTDPWGRGERSLRSVQLWVYGGSEAAEEGRRLRRLHGEIQGTDTRGRPYRALDPAAYAWVHATGFPVYQHAQRYVGSRPYTEAEERALYAEWLQVGRVLGIDDGDMPQTLEEFWPYYERVLAEELEKTTVVRELTAVDRTVPPPDRGPRTLRWVLRALWPVLRPPLARFRSFITVGMIPPSARQAIGIPWTDRQERRLLRFSRLVRAVVPRLPERLRYLPIARRARAAHRAETTAT